MSAARIPFSEIILHSRRMISDYFLDESGNTGDLIRSGNNFDFGQQEIFALACLGVGDTDALGVELVRLKTKYRISAPELKFKFVRDKPGFVLELADFIERMNWPLLAEVVDKRFMLTANIVNAVVLPPFGPASMTRQAFWVRNIMAEHIHAHAPSSLFERFIAACDAPSADSIPAVFEAVMDWLPDRTENEVAFAIRESVSHSRAEFEEMGPDAPATWRRFLPSPDIGKRGQSVWMLPNLTSFTNIYARLNHLHRRDINGITLFHDQQDHFDDILIGAKQMVEEIGGGDATPEVRFADYRFSEDARLMFMASHESPGIQAADVLAGFLMRYTKQSLYEGAVSQGERAAFMRILELSEPSEGRGINFVLKTADLLPMGVIPA